MRNTSPAWKTHGRARQHGAITSTSAVAQPTDNLSSHTRKALVDRFGEKISLFSRQCLGRRRIPTLGELQREARAWNRKMNRDRVTINWQFTRKKARKKFGYNRNEITRSET